MNPITRIIIAILAGLLLFVGGYLAIYPKQAIKFWYEQDFLAPYSSPMDAYTDSIVWQFLYRAFGIVALGFAIVLICGVAFNFDIIAWHHIETPRADR